MLEISLILKGFFIGASMLVPGVSGGTMAMILGIYDRLVSSISSFFKHKKESFFFLLQFVLGAARPSSYYPASWPLLRNGFLSRRPSLCWEPFWAVSP